jgi:hypothetical protein
MSKPALIFFSLQRVHTTKSTVKILVANKHCKYFLTNIGYNPQSGNPPEESEAAKVMHKQGFRITDETQIRTNTHLVTANLQEAHLAATRAEMPLERISA